MKAELLAQFDYQFRDADLLEQALTHRSAEGRHNERLEFLGDAVLGLVIAEDLYQRFPKAHEGQLSRLRSQLVDKQSLAQVANDLELGQHLILGASAGKSGGRQRQSILADAMEALFGAIYCDGGYAAVKQSILRLFSHKLNCLDLEQLQKDPKTRLQERCQQDKKALPVYTLLMSEGRAHEQTFHVSCQVPGSAMVTQGQGGSRREAEQIAAKLYLEQSHD